MTKASVFKILTSEPDLTGLNAEQRFLLEKMLEKEPSDRPTAESLTANLGDIRDGQQPELQSSYVGAAKKTNDATTTTKRAVLNSTVQSSKQTAASSNQGGNSNIVAAATASRKRNWLVVASVAAVAVLGVSLLVANSSGSGKVSVAVAIDDDNPAVGDFALRLSSGSIEPVVRSLSEKESHDSVFTWKSGDPIRVAYDPPFSEDEEFVGTIMPSDLGLNGYSNGEQLYIQVSLEKTSTLLSFRTGANRTSNEVYAIRLSRGNETEALIECVSELAGQIKTQTASYRALYDAYESAIERANLAFFGDGETVLQWTTWASRAGQVRNFMESDLQAAELGSSLEPAARNYVSGIVDAQTRLMQSWSNFRAASQRQSQSDFTATAEAIYTLEARLQSVVGLSPNSFAKSDCEESVE